MAGEIELFSEVEQCFAWNSADIKTGASQRFELINQSSRQVELSRADSRDVAAGTRADHDKVIAFLSHGLANSGMNNEDLRPEGADGIRNR